MADRKTDAYADGVKLAQGLTGVFETLEVPNNRSVFGLGYALAKASGYTDADAAMSFIEGFTNVFDAERQKRLPAPDKENEKESS